MEEEKLKEVEEISNTGQVAARRRLLHHQQQIKFDLLPEEQQRILNLKKQARLKANENRLSRLKFIHEASFCYW